MESQNSGSRRLSRIACHVTAGNEDVKSNNILAMKYCTNTLNYAITRCDNRVLFARQGSSSQAPFMRQVSLNQVEPLKMQDNKANVQPYFAKPVPQSGLPTKVATYEPLLKDLEMVEVEIPRFARLGSRGNRTSKNMMEENRSKLKGLTCGSVRVDCPKVSDNKAQEWSPRMDVLEHQFFYGVTIELPGVSSSNIRVELDDKNLLVIGSRPNQWVPTDTGDGIQKYHKKEITSGPFRVAWLLPGDVNKDHVSAEFVDGILRIKLPKV